jgi:hypothetical protein
VNTFRTPAGATRLCPHCRAVILQSASTCPACRKHLKFEPGAAATPAPSFSALNLEGTVRHPNVGQPWEYSVMVSIRNDKGEEVARQVVNVGALEPGEQRSFTFSVDVFVPGDTRATTPATADLPVNTPAVAVAASPGSASVPSGTRPGMPPVTSGTRPAVPPLPPAAPAPSVPGGPRPPGSPSVPSGTRPGAPSVPSGTRPRR